MNAKDPLRTEVLLCALGLATLASCGSASKPNPAVGGDGPRAAPQDAAITDTPGPAVGPDAARPDQRPLLPVDLGPIMTTDAPPATPDGLEPPEGKCPGDIKDLDAWFPVTPPVVYFKPLPHPETECPFYVFAFQHFLIATQPDPQGRPAFLRWNTIENTFGAHAGEPSPEIPVLTGGANQAGARQTLVDRNGHAIHYGIHFNQRFVNFVYENKLTTAEAVRNADPNLRFDSPDIVELKSAWQIVDDAAPPASFMVSKARVPSLKIVNGKTVEDYSKLREVTVALIALHVVFTIPGHPEFIWSTFEHVNANTGISDIAPSSRTQPAGTSGVNVLSQVNHVLYKAGTTAGNANKGIVNPMFDEATQTFAAAETTSIYRAFPGSLSHQPEIDEDVVSLNQNLLARYKALPAPAAGDRRVNYLMVGTIWLDRPEDTFRADRELVNDPNDPDIVLRGPESLKSITGGEDRLSSTAMESFTQEANSFPNCFSCHDTRGATVSGVPRQRDMSAEPLMGPKQIGVSHVFNEVLRLNP